MEQFAKIHNALSRRNSSLNYDIYHMAKLVRDAGFVPVKRNTIYTEFNIVDIEPLTC